MANDAPTRLPYDPLASVKWLLILLLMAASAGSASAFFLWSLDALTKVRFQNPGLIWLLPIGGLLVGWIYRVYGGSAAGGNNLLIDEIHQPGAGVPRRMGPLVLLGTLVTHLFGGSAGREGTAVQMGGAVAAFFARALKLDGPSVRVLLMVGVAAGFGSVFGTPIAGAVFAMEVLVIGRVQYDALIPCFIGSLVAHWTCTAWGIGHTQYHVAVAGGGGLPDVALLVKVLVASVVVGWVAALFAECSHRLAGVFNRWIPRAEVRPFAGGLLVIGLFLIAGTDDYLGLGVLGKHDGSVTLPAMFGDAEIPALAWIWKFVFTVVTLSSGFKGGEVTPLFFIGAALGNSLATIMGAPTDLFAAIGFVAIFGAATNTPLASALLGMELFGAGNGLYLATGCIIAYRFSGHRGIYAAQRLGVPKFQPSETDK